MGAETFFVRKIGQYKDANEAFREAVDDAQYEHGHGGYTGTIAEKSGFQMVEVPPRKDPSAFADFCFENDEGKFWEDKWGPAACIEVKGTWLQKMRGERWKGKRNFKCFYFFGWASS